MIKDNLIHIREKIEAALDKRNDEFQKNNFKLVAVTKNHDIAAMREAMEEGILAVGENRVQEALQKSALLARDTKWHLLGHLQTNKVKQAVKLFDLIQSVDSEKLAVEIDRAAAELNKIQDILLQVNLAKEESKFGIYREELPEFIQFVAGLSNVRICGLMTIMPHDENTENLRPLFREMHGLFVELKTMNLKNSNVKWLSMGMTNDYEIAIQEGANLVRIGTGIFGQRQY